MTIIRVGQAQVLDVESIYNKGLLLRKHWCLKKVLLRTFFQKPMTYGADILKLTMLLVYQITLLDSDHPIQILLISTET